MNKARDFKIWNETLALTTLSVKINLIVLLLEEVFENAI